MGRTQDSDVADSHGANGSGNGAVQQRSDAHRPDETDADFAQRTEIDREVSEFYQSFAIKPFCRYRVQNRTPYLVHIVHENPALGELVLPPLGDRIIQGARLAPFKDRLRLHRQRHEVFVGLYEERISTVAKLVWFAWVALLAPLGIALHGIVKHGRPGFESSVASAIAAGVIAVVLLIAAEIERRRKQKAVLDGIQAGDIEVGVGGSYSDGNETARDVRQLMTFVMVLGVGALFPALAILIATDTHEFLVLDGGLRVHAGLESRLVARVIQMIYTCVLSLFPALLFFQFDRLRAGSIRAEWIRALFRMDGRMRTLADVNATYGDAMYEASNNADDSVRGLGGKNSPIIIATVLIALGWTILVVRTESFDFNGATKASQQVQVAKGQAARADEAAAKATAEKSTVEEANAALADASVAAAEAGAALEATSETADVSTQADVDTTTPDGTTTTRTPADDAAVTTTTLVLAEARAAALAQAAEAQGAVKAATVEETQIQSTQFFQVLAPNPSAAGMAFLGAYFFGIYLILRSYFRGDLRSKLYNQITARLVTVVVVAYLINAIVFTNTDQQRVVWALAFLAGVVPTTVLDRVFHALGSLVQSVVGDTFSADRPLEHIDGIDIYDAGRLESEGIPDVAALATSDLASVMLQTRIPIGRLVDWADQAALLVVVATPSPHLDPRIRCLRTRGVRTATDLLAAIEAGNFSTIEQCLLLPPHAGRHGWWNDRRNEDGTSGNPEQISAATSGEGSTPSADAGSANDLNASDDTGAVAELVDEVLQQHIDTNELCDAIRRQPVMSQILQWRSSALDDVDTCWIPLPDIDARPPVSVAYHGPLPAGPQAQIGSRSRSISGTVGPAV